MPVLCINLNSKQEQWEARKKHLTQEGFQQVHRFSAIDGQGLNCDQAPLSLFARYLLNHPNKRSAHEQVNSLGQIGCYLSHVGCWQMMIDKNWPECIITEDDIVLHPNSLCHIQASYEALPTDWDFLSFAYLQCRDEAWGSSQCSRFGRPFGSLLKRCGMFFGLQGYILSQRGAKILLKNAYPIEAQVDAYISFLAVQDRINLYMTCQSYLSGHNNVSTTQTQSCYKCDLPDREPDGWEKRTCITYVSSHRAGLGVAIWGLVLTSMLCIVLLSLYLIRRGTHIGCRPEC